MRRIFTNSQDSILSAVSIISVTYILSYALSFIKQRFLISAYGVDIGVDSNTSLLGLFFLADKIPSLIFNSLVAGSLSVALIPVFTKKIAAGGEKEAWELASKVLNITLGAFAVISLFVFVFTRQLASVLALSSNPDPVLLNLIRIMMLSQFVLIISIFETSALQSLKRFFAPSLAPVVYNVGIIVFVALFAKRWGIYAPAWGMLFGAFLHFAIQFPVLKKLNFFYRLNFSFDEGARNVFLTALPRTFGIIADQIAMVVDTSLAFFIAPSATAILVLTSSLQKLPSAVIGSSLAQVLLPKFSYLSQHDRGEFLALVRSSCIKALYFILPASVVLLVLRIPIVRLVYGVSGFSWDATIASSYTLAFFSFSIFAQSLIYILVRAFYAENDTKTPFRAGLISILVNIVLSAGFVLTGHFGVWSLGLSYSFGVITNLVILERFFKSKIGNLLTEDFLEQASKISWASFILGVCLYIPLKFLDNYIFDTSRTLYLLLLTLVVSTIGVVSYYRISVLLKIRDTAFFRARLLEVARKFQRVILEWRFPAPSQEG